MAHQRMNTPRAGLRVEALELRDWGPIRELSLPRDGLGWPEGRIPDTVLVGGVNGSGKSTLLKSILLHFEALERSTKPDLGGLAPPFPQTTSQLEYYSRSSNTLQWKTDPDIKNYFYTVQPQAQIHHIHSNKYKIIHVSSETRQLIYFHQIQKIPYKQSNNYAFINSWSPPQRWEDSLESYLYSLRWDYLSAKEEHQEGQPQPIDASQQYGEDFYALTDGEKKLVWSKGEPKIQTASGALHGLEDLSSGEKQLLLLLIELRRLWTPGSLLLLDEPELHLHEMYQAKIYQHVCQLIAREGGQAWIATQSDFLFQHGEPGTKLLLRGG